MKNSFYFDHDYGSRNDQKLLKLRAKFGAEGYGIFWMMIETMAEDSTGYIDGDSIDALSLCFGVPIDKLNTVLEYMLNIGLIKKCEHGNLYNCRILNHKKFRSDCSNYGLLGAKKRWGKNGGAIRGAISTPNAKERKGKERKE